MLQRPDTVPRARPSPQNDGTIPAAPRFARHHTPQPIIPQEYVPLHTSDPPSVSPYILRHNQAQKVTENSIPKILEWVVPSRKRYRRHRSPLLDDEEQRYAGSRRSSHWLSQENIGGREAFRYQGDGNFIRNQAPGDDYLRSLMHQYMLQQGFQTSRLPHNAYQYGHDQDTRQYPQVQYPDFDQQALYGDRGQPMRLLPTPEPAAATHDDRARNLAVDVWDPTSSTTAGRGQQYNDPNPLMQGGNIDFRAGSRHRAAFHSQERNEIGGRITAQETKGRDGMKIIRGSIPPGHLNTSQRAHPLIDNSLVAKYTALDEHYPTDGESMHILREEDPASSFENRGRHDSERESRSNEDDQPRAHRKPEEATVVEEVD